MLPIVLSSSSSSTTITDCRDGTVSTSARGAASGAAVGVTGAASATVVLEILFLPELLPLEMDTLLVVFLLVKYKEDSTQPVLIITIDLL